MAFADDVRAAAAVAQSLPHISAQTLYNTVKAAVLIAHASGLPSVSYTLPTGFSYTVSLDSATKLLESLRDMAASESGGVVFQRVEMP